MDKIFYAIYNKKENKFLSIYEDGKGNEYFRRIEFGELGNGGIFNIEERAKYVLQSAKNIAGFATRMVMDIEYAREFLMDCSIVPIQVSVRFDSIEDIIKEMKG